MQNKNTIDYELEMIDDKKNKLESHQKYFINELANSTIRKISIILSFIIVASTFPIILIKLGMISGAIDKSKRGNNYGHSMLSEVKRTIKAKKKIKEVNEQVNYLDKTKEEIGKELEETKNIEKINVK